ncbi:PIN domain-containing protein [Chryseobacterium sp. SL1]|uniref:PIN domain-containing protein n=1 Tax=Chryseobacterium sp. SL1 TaxID=2995159 RepID=UPI002272F721|nr:PIN domain-containing protein [Chryseobacterium sp. SL1]MCY1660898.1 PIN domain-containing protein [Chryseobacterium sp. SL1]
MGRFKRNKSKKRVRKQKTIGNPEETKYTMLKTLIVFDTNALRSTEAGQVAYRFFAFGKPFQMIEEYINANHLNEHVHLAIPSWAIEELKDQKNRQYLEDIEKYKEVTERLFGLPSFQKVPLPQEEFDCRAYVQEKAEEFLAAKQLKQLDIKEELASTVLKSMMSRVLKEEKLKKPFANSGKYKDAGFKDNIVWESLMHYDDVEAYDKFIFITKDTDYGNCQKEFKEKWNKHIIILKDENSVKAEILKDYELYINERAIYEFTQTEYFKDYLFDGLKTKTEISFEATNFKIENFEIADTCANVERLPPNEDLEENVIIHSGIKIFFSENAEKKEQIVVAKTTLADDETKEILETTYEPELI